MNDRVVIVTGFGAFQDYLRDDDNPSNALARDVANEVSGRGLRCECVSPLSVTWGEFGHVLAAQIERHRGSRVSWIALGAGKDFAIETRAINRRTVEKPDASGQWAGKDVASFNAPDDAPDSVHDIPLSAVSLFAMQRHFRERGLNVRLSRDAGGYICNAAAYAMYAAKHAGSIESGVFLHTPAIVSPEQRDAFAHALADILVSDRGILHGAG
jgi:pyroglutamyl-peptidase